MCAMETTKRRTGRRLDTGSRQPVVDQWRCRGGRRRRYCRGAISVIVGRLPSVDHRRPATTNVAGHLLRPLGHPSPRKLPSPTSAWPVPDHSVNQGQKSPRGGECPAATTRDSHMIGIRRAPISGGSSGHCHSGGRN